MHASLNLRAAAPAIVAALALAACQPSAAGSVVATQHPTAAPSAAPTEPGPTPEPTEAHPPEPTAVFESKKFGLSIGYPEGWKTTDSRVPWKMAPGDYIEPLGDLIEDPTHEFLWIKLASLPMGDTSFKDWYAGVFEGHGCGFGAREVTIDGVEGLVNDGCHTALVASGGRGYLISAHLCPCELAQPAEWDRWFSQLLTTVRLEPEKAVDGR